jgi:hypothetical protein
MDSRELCVQYSSQDQAAALPQAVCNPRGLSLKQVRF